MMNNKRLIIKEKLIKKSLEKKTAPLSLYPKEKTRKLIDTKYGHFKSRLNSEGFKSISKSTWILMLLEATLLEESF